MGGLLSLSLEISQNSASVLGSVRENTKDLRVQLGDTATTVNSLKTEILQSSQKSIFALDGVDETTKDIRVQLGDTARMLDNLSTEVRGISQNADSVLDGMNETTQEIHSQVANTATAVTSLSADMRRFVEMSQQDFYTPRIVATVQRAMKDVLQEHAFRIHQTEPTPERGSCLSISVAECDMPHRGFNKVRRGPHYHSKRELLCKNSLITILKTTSTADADNEENEQVNEIELAKVAGSSYRTITTFDVLLDLGFWRRGLKAVMGQSRESYTPGLDFCLRTYHIVDLNAPIFEAAEAFDIETVRTLFSSRQASPFDQSTQGWSLFDYAFQCLCMAQRLGDASKGLRFLKFLISCGGMPTSLGDKYGAGSFPWIEDVLKEGIPLEVRQALVDAMRLVFKTSSEDPISKWDVGICFTLKSQKTPMGEIIKQQDYWPLELGIVHPKNSLRPGAWLAENDRQIIEDENGTSIALLLPEADKYTAINPIVRGGWNVPSGIHSVLKLYSDSDCKEKIYVGCRNRIIILLTSGYDPRGLERCTVYSRWTYTAYKMSVTQYALFTNTCHLWQEVLEHLGWTRGDIDDLFNEEQYLGVGELLSGNFEFMSQEENRHEFLEMLASGRSVDSKTDMDMLPLHIKMTYHDIEQTMKEGYQAFQRKSTPGTWYDNGFSKLTLGVDFFLWSFWGPGNWKCYASFDEYDECYR